MGRVFKQMYRTQSLFEEILGFKLKIYETKHNQLPKSVTLILKLAKLASKSTMVNSIQPHKEEHVIFVGFNLFLVYF